MNNPLIIPEKAKYLLITPWASPGKSFDASKEGKIPLIMISHQLIRNWSRDPDSTWWEESIFSDHLVDQVTSIDGLLIIINLYQEVVADR